MTYFFTRQHTYILKFEIEETLSYANHMSKRWIKLHQQTSSTNLYSKIVGQANDGFFFLICGDVRHKSKIFHQSTGLKQPQIKRSLIQN